MRLDQHLAPPKDLSPVHLKDHPNLARLRNHHNQHPRDHPNLHLAPHRDQHLVQNLQEEINHDQCLAPDHQAQNKVLLRESVLLCQM